MSTLKNSYREQIEQWGTPAKPPKPAPRSDHFVSGIFVGLIMGCLLAYFTHQPAVTLKVEAPHPPLIAQGRGLEPTVIRAKFDISYVRTCDSGFKKVFIDFTHEACLQNDLIEEIHRENDVEDRRHETHADTSLHQ